MLKKSIESVLKQTYREYELIVVDDGSIDSTKDLEILKTSNSNFIRLDINSGVSRARNVGVAHSKGDWIAFLDSDDLWHKNKLAHQVAWIKKNPEYRISQTKEIWIREGKRVNPPKTHEKVGGDIFSISLERCMVTPSSVIMQRTLFDEVGGFNEMLPACEDYDLWLRITSRFPVGLLDEYLLTRYGGHKDQLSSTVTELDRFRVRSLLDLLIRGQLSLEQENAARSKLREKACILANGYKKRGNLNEYEHYCQIAGQYGRPE